MTGGWQYYSLKIIVRLVCCLPYSGVRHIGRFVGRLYYRIGHRQRERALLQARDGLGITGAQAESVIRTLFSNLGQTLLEVMYLPRLRPDVIQKYVEIENRHFLDQAVAEGKGVAVLTAHIGNWEWLGAGLAMYGFPVASIVKAQPNEQHTRILNDLRQAAGIEIFTRGTTELVSAAKALKSGRVMGFFIDQDVGNKGIFVDFLGKKASTPTGLALFTRKFRVPVVPAYIVRKPEGGHRIIIGSPLEYTETGNAAADIYNFTLKANQAVGNIIRKHPDEWLWFQKRWDTEWAGEEV